MFAALVLGVGGYWLYVKRTDLAIEDQWRKETRFLMGTIVEVASDDERAADIAFAEMSRVEALVSKYKEYSEVATLNSAGKIEASADTMYLIRRSKEFWQDTGGAFDITVAPLLDIWGFTTRDFRMPEEKEIKDALKRVGCDKILIDERKNIVRFKVRGMEIDLGGIAKGYAVDCAIKRLKDAGIKNALVNAGGDMYCLGNKNGKPWKVAIQDPRGKGYVEYLELQDKAVATSGDYEQYFEIEGKRFSHIFDPRTGYPADTAIVSVTVIADDCLTADAWATSMFVLGKEKGEELARRYPDIAIKIIKVKEKTKF